MITQTPYGWRDAQGNPIPAPPTTPPSTTPYSPTLYSPAYNIASTKPRLNVQTNHVIAVLLAALLLVIGVMIGTHGHAKPTTPSTPSTTNPPASSTSKQDNCPNMDVTCYDAGYSAGMHAVSPGMDASIIPGTCRSAVIGSVADPVMNAQQEADMIAGCIAGAQHAYDNGIYS